MNTAFITPFHPTKFNISGPSSLPYAILAGRPRVDHELTLIATDHVPLGAGARQAVLTELGIDRSAALERKPRLLRQFAGLLAMASGLPHQVAGYRMSAEAASAVASADRIVAYYFWVLPLIALSAKPVWLIGPDCLSLRYRRTMRRHPAAVRRIWAWVQWHLALRLERLAGQCAERVFFVGRDDGLYYRLSGNRNGQFMRHPLPATWAAA